MPNPQSPIPNPQSPPNNPYIAGSPLKGQEMFFGRDDIFEKVRANLVGEHQDNAIVIYGQRRTGKTSVLYQMERRLNAAEGRERYVVVLVDLQRFEFKDEDHFLWQLAGTIWRVLRRDYGLTRPERAPFKSDARYAFRDGFLPTVQTALGERSLLLMFDEAMRLEEAVAQDKLRPEIFAYLRSLIEHEDNISFIFSLDRKPDSLLPEYSRMLNVVSSLHVSFLNERAARSLVTEPVADCYSFDDDALNHLLALTSHHPYFTQVICHTLFTRWEQQRLRRLTCADIDAVLEEATSLCVVNLKYSWDESMPAQKFVLAGLAEVDADKVSLATLEQHLQQAEIYLGVSEISTALGYLAQREVIDSPSHPRFHVMLLRRWLRREKPLLLVRDELAEHVPEPPIAVRQSKQGDEYRAQGQGDLALQAYAEALNDDSTYLPAWLGQGEIFMARHTWSEAIECFGQVVNLEPEHSAAHEALLEARLAQAGELLHQGQEEKAKAEYQAVLALQPENTKAIAALERLATPLWLRHLAYRWTLLKQKRQQLIPNAIAGLFLALLLLGFSYFWMNSDKPSYFHQWAGSWTRPLDRMTMVFVPAGSFIMGSTPDDIEDALQLCRQSALAECKREWFDDEQPQHDVTLDAFWIDKSEVSNQQYEACVQSGQCQPSTFADDPLYNGANYPVVGVDWHNARAYCQSVGADLPTEAQWEKAARGTDGRLYPWGNQFDETKLNFCDVNCLTTSQNKDYNDAYAYTAPVDSFTEGASPVGALNMSGNVWEWILDGYSYSYYAQSDGSHNPSGANNSNQRVSRGGSWTSPLFNPRIATRRFSHPDLKNKPNLGFRCVLSTLAAENNEPEQAEEQ